MNVLVTGGGGFLGGAIVRWLLERGHRVRSLCRGNYPELEALGVELHRGDVADADAATAAAAGCEAVFHVAAKAGFWGPYAEYHRSNVQGTANIIAACRKHGVAKLIHTSTPSVVHAGGDIEGGDESLPYPEHFESPYPKSKAIAERMVIEANGASLATVALRPHLIWGPGDTNLVPRVVARARAGSLRMVGSTPRRIDTTYIDNAAEAHLLACERLGPGAPCAGRAYFISQGDPVPLHEFVNRVLVAAGVPPVDRHVPFAVAYALGAVLEGAYKLLPLRGEPAMTRFLARQFSTAHWFNITAARRDLGYEPRVSIDEGLIRLANFYRTKPSQA
jgi:nucleoside-diphosphate-sugar epimerase